MLMLSVKNTGNSTAGKVVMKLDNDFFYNAQAGDSNTRFGASRFAAQCEATKCSTGCSMVNG